MGLENLLKESEIHKVCCVILFILTKIISTKDSVFHFSFLNSSLTKDCSLHLAGRSLQKQPIFFVCLLKRNNQLWE